MFRADEMQRAPEDSEQENLHHFISSSQVWSSEKLKSAQALLEKKGKVEFEPRFTWI